MSDLERITHLDGLMIESRASIRGSFNVNSTLNPPTVIDDVQRNTIINTNDKAAPIKKGTLVYNEGANSVQAFQGDADGAWVSLGAGGGGGDVTGPVNSTDTHIVTFNGDTGKIIADSGVALANIGTVTSVGVTAGGGLTTSVNGGDPVIATGTLGLAVQAAAPGTYVFLGTKDGGGATLTMVVDDKGIITSITAA